MALASFSQRATPTAEEKELTAFLLSSEHVRLDLYDQLESSAYYNVGTDDPEFRNFAGIFSDAIFETFKSFAKTYLREGLPLVIAGGCGLNCDWNAKWTDTGIFSDVFVPPVANDSGSAIGTAIDAQLHLTGDAKIEWDVYSGLPFTTDGPIVRHRYDVHDCERRRGGAYVEPRPDPRMGQREIRDWSSLSAIGPFSPRHSTTRRGCA